MLTEDAEEGAGEVVPDAEDSARNTGHGHGGKMLIGKGAGETAILHANLDAHSDALRPYHAT